MPLLRRLILLVAIFLLSCGEPAAVKPLGELIEIRVPLGLPPLPKSLPPTQATVALGEKLFFSPLLSIDGTRSCAACHKPEAAFTDELPLALGLRGQKTKRNSPTVLNAAYNRVQFWDGRAPTLEAQAEAPILNSLEMGHDAPGIEKKLNASDALQPLFLAAFGPGPATLQKAAIALAAYERTLLSGNSAFDRFVYGGDQTALSESAQRGLAFFRDPARGNCTACHVIASDHALFTDHQFHNLGAGMNPRGELSDLGRYEVTRQDSDRGAFRTPSLRNVARTAPYMHDGSLATLDDVIAFYIAGGNANEHLDRLMKPLAMTQQERRDLLAFLLSLNGDDAR